MPAVNAELVPTIGLEHEFGETYIADEYLWHNDRGSDAVVAQFEQHLPCQT